MPKYYIKNGKPSEINLNDKDFVASGGEGNVYSKSGLIYKIYHDPSKMIPESKIKELSCLCQDNIIIPLNILLDSKQNKIGYTMKLIKDSFPLCKLFTNDFRNRFNVTNDTVINLIKQMQKDISFIHSKGILQVDGNEMNYLVSNDFKIPYFIDTDSYQTKSFKATAIMPSIRDHHTKEFNELTDWFSFAIIVTQLFLGIHPYKGTHPNFKKSDMEGRMKANISIFNKDVSLPAVVRDFSLIPSNYKEWLERVLEKGERLVPPCEAGIFVSQVKQKGIIEATKFILELIQEYQSPILKYNNGYIYREKFIHKNKLDIPNHTLGMEIIESSISKKPIQIYIENGILSIGNIAAEEKMVVDNSVFIKNEDRLTEINIQEFNGKIFPEIKNSWNIMPNSTKIFNGLIYQNILNTHWLMIPYKISNNRAMYQKAIPELKGYAILEGKYQGQIANIIAEKNGVYSSFMFKFKEDFSEYIYFEEIDVDYHIPNFVVLDNGIVVRNTIDDEVHIFSSRFDKQDTKVLKDPAVTFEMKLYKDGMTVVGIKENKLYKIKTKN